ncbi:hypothetical protein DQV23_05355 [Staphylococcus aureus]|nr:hypothetical protein A7U44_03190 [Staphylococcus aureus]AXG02171.1 hypothetical protein DU470_05435 [Staphylococcus aureus]AXG04881.1 hypothetical protein DU471_05305 [Staphylococcus aureus]MBG0910838.1 hypothetical protein [Staphylococcus aureus]MBG1092268.1 hypothetical protein [Staphylococcus aureus]
MILQMDNFSTILFALKLCIQFSILNSHHLNQSNLVTKKVLSINFIDLYLNKLEIYLTYSVHIKMFNRLYFYNAFNYGRSRNCNE